MKNVEEYTAPNCRLLATNLEQAIGRLQDWGIRIVDVNRLREAVNELHAAADAGAYPRDLDRLRAIGFAIRTGHEFRYIASCLPAERMHEIATDLQQSTAGDLVESSHDRTAYQFQVQLWLGAVIAFSGHTAVVPSEESQARADFYVQNGLRWYGFEVKRPGTEAGARKRLKKAARQLASTRLHMGAVVLDLTELFGVEEVAIVARGAAEKERRRLVKRFVEISTCLEEQIFSEENRQFRSGYEHIGAFLAFVRGFVWNVDDLTHPELFQQARFVSFSADAGPTLWWHRAQWLANILVKGTQATGHRMKQGAEHPIW